MSEETKQATPKGINLANILTTLLMLYAEYRKGRAEVIANGDPTDPNTGAVKTDTELIALLSADADELTEHIDGLLAQYRTPAQPAE